VIFVRCRTVANVLSMVIWSRSMGVSGTSLTRP
jgi:hypothetical protein